MRLIWIDDRPDIEGVFEILKKCWCGVSAGRFVVVEQSIVRTRVRKLGSVAESMGVKWRGSALRS
jgi:hypothetical protein